MEARRVVRTEKQMMWPGGLHPHVAALVLEDGCRVTADDVIWRLDVRSVAYRVVVEGRAGDVAVERCAVCAVDRLTTSLDVPGREVLLTLPD